MKRGMMRRRREGKTVIEDIEKIAQDYESRTGHCVLLCCVDPEESRIKLPKRLIRKHGLIIEIATRSIGKGQLWIGLPPEE